MKSLYPTPAFCSRSVMICNVVVESACIGIPKRINGTVVTVECGRIEFAQKNSLSNFVKKLFWICRHNERICSPQGASNIHSIESSRLSHEINTLLASPEPDAESIVRKILHRAELQFTCCSAGDADPATLQIKRACNELEPTDTFPLKLYAEIVSNVILYRDTHIEIKLRNGQIL